MSFNVSSSEESSKKTLEDFEVDQSKYPKGIIGKGAFSFVKLVKDKQTGVHYAMKIISKSELLDKSSIVQMKQEIKIHKKLQHPHIIKLYHYFEDKYFIYMIMEYAENGMLFTYLKKKKRLTESEAFIFFFQTCLGIDYLHKNDVMHRDLKPENLLIDSKGNIKLCDFGWSTENIGFKKQTFCGTLNYMAPEILQNCNYNYKVDIWGLGILLYEMLHGSAPDAYQFILNRNFLEIDPSLSTQARELILSLLKFDSKERIGLEEIFKHQWLLGFESVYKIKIENYVNNNNRVTRNERENRNNKENHYRKAEASLNSIRTETRVIYAKSLNKYSENFSKIDCSLLKIPKKVEENEASKESNNFIDKFFSAIGCVKRDKLTTKKRNII